MSTQKFGNLVLNNSVELNPFAITLTRDEEAAKDLCQETLYKAFANRDKFMPGTNVKAWLFTIMRNIFINDYRRNGRKKILIDSIKHSGEPFVLSAEISIHLKEINTAIHRLPAIFKTCCLLYLNGYKYQEIACALNEPLGTIKSRIHFAKKILQKQIER